MQKASGAALPSIVAAPPHAEPTSTEGLDGDALRAYRMALAIELRRHKHYPQQAQEAGRSGTAEVRLIVDTFGQMLPPVLLRSSGDEELDEQALAMVREAAPRALLPEALHGRGFALSLPIEFDVHGD